MPKLQQSGTHTEHTTHAICPFYEAIANGDGVEGDADDDDDTVDPSQQSAGCISGRVYSIQAGEHNLAVGGDGCEGNSVPYDA